MITRLTAFWLSVTSFFVPAVHAGTTPTTGIESLIPSAQPVAYALPPPCQHLEVLVKGWTENPYNRAIQGRLGVWDMVVLLAACGFVQTLRTKWTQRAQGDGSKAGADQSGPEKQRNSTEYSDSSPIDPGLLKKYSSFKSYETTFATYHSVRTFYRPHSQADKLPRTPPLPLLVFIHGLGGSLSQFHHLLTSLVNVAPCLGFDLPGCGRSSFPDKLPWQAYSTMALAELVSVIVRTHCNSVEGQGVVLVGHSMGCSLSVMLSSQKSLLHSKNGFVILGQISICPKASCPTQEQVVKFRRLLRVPTPIFDLWRRWDRRGGLKSASVTRFVGRSADIDTRKLQLKFNENSRTSVWRRMAWGALPEIQSDGTLIGGLPGPDTWSGVVIPLFLIAGEADSVTKAEELSIIGKAVEKGCITSVGEHGVSSGVVLQPVASSTDSSKLEEFKPRNEEYCGISSAETTVFGSEPCSKSNSVDVEKSQSQPRAILKTTILPSPAGHALLYDQATYRTLSGLIQSFLAGYIDSRLSLGWQLQHLCTEGKWDVKNLVKWQAVKPVSEPIAGIFRAMKTLREIDESHSPAIFVRNWKDKIRAVIDISHESPVYNPAGLENGGIEYHKFPTVSKIPPTTEEVKDFIALVDRLRTNSLDHNSRLIGVHCHYGFNRTGFFICSYLIERELYDVQRALDTFQECRPPGIRHEHFIDTLFVRYCVGLRRAPTL